MSASDALGRRVRPSGWPQGETGWRPPEVLPSPPPIGWSIGFIATPRTLGTNTLPPISTGLAHLDELVLGVADRPEGRPAVDRHPSHLRRRQTQRGEAAVLGDELDAHAGAAGHLAPTAGAQLDVVHGGTRRDVAHRQGVARADVGPGARLDDVAHLEALGSQDVALLTVGVVQQSDAARSVGVVLDRGNLRRDGVLVALEVDDAVLLLVTATAVARSLAAVAVAPAGTGLGGEQRLLGVVLGDLREVRDRLEPTTRARGFAITQCHGLP